MSFPTLSKIPRIQLLEKINHINLWKNFQKMMTVMLALGVVVELSRVWYGITSFPDEFTWEIGETGSVPRDGQWDYAFQPVFMFNPIILKLTPIGNSQIIPTAAPYPFFSARIFSRNGCLTYTPRADHYGYFGIPGDTGRYRVAVLEGSEWVETSTYSFLSVDEGKPITVCIIDDDNIPFNPSFPYSGMVFG